MNEMPTASGLNPPLRLLWQTDSLLQRATAGNDSLYGISSGGNVVALDGASGTQRWQSNGGYLPKHLVRQNSRLFAFRRGDGLVFIDDQKNHAVETVTISFPAAEDTNIAAPVLDDRMLYLAVNQGLYAYHQDQGLQFASILSDVMPHTVGLIASREILTIDGRGVPTRYHVAADSFRVVWTGEDSGINAGQTQRPFVVVGSRLLIGLGNYTVAYDLNTGRIAWTLSNVPSRAFATDGTTVYSAFSGMSLWAFRASDGEVLWERQYFYDLVTQRDYDLVLSGGYLYFGATTTAADGALLAAATAADGAFTWLSRGVTAQWAGGSPNLDANRLYCYGGSKTGAYAAPVSQPRVTADRITVTPRPLRGPTQAFGTGTVQVDLPSSAQISIAPYREHEGLGSRIVNSANWSAGSHSASWSPGASGGFTDSRQFGFILVDVAESGANYTQALLLPVNTFPDILRHWARTNIETMVYHRYLSGYADQTFKPDNLVTRAESSTIIAKTLNLEGPSPGFHTKFTDINGHWAWQYIVALEEQGIVGGFREPDGTYTFRPELNMTRAEEAKIVVRAYHVPSAPASFRSKFTDISGHWAEADIKALEAAGYVNGFQESDGTYTYRPEQNLTRAELCTMVVRILGLTR